MSWVAANTKVKQSGVATPSVGYVRPADWLTMPTLTVSDQTLVRLIAVRNDATGLNKIAFTVAGAYTVDWGDGSVTQNFASGAKAEHEYAWSDIPAETLTSLGYRQCLCIVTPQAGQSLTAFDIRVWPTTYPIMWSQPIVSFSGSGASITTMGFGGDNAKTYAPLILLREINIIKISAVKNFSYAWRNCTSLQSLTVDTSSGTDFYNAFAGCTSLKSLTVDTSSGTNFCGAFNGCASLKSLTVDTSSGTDFNNAFNDCTSLQSLTINASSGTDFSYAFNGCTSLQSLTVDASSGTNFNCAWRNCTSLQSLTITASSGTNFNSAFAGCKSLQSLTINTSLGTNFSSAFNDCTSLQSLTINASSGTDFSYAFDRCTSLQSLIATGLKVSFSVSDTKLGTDALVALFTSLGTATGSTLTCSGCSGYAGLTAPQRAVATDKGWTLA